MPADPTIPQLVARLRELHAKLQALQVGTPEFTAARQLFRDVLQLSAPGILDALDHIGDANKMASSPWVPIEEFEDPKKGSVCLGWFRDGAPRLVTHHLGKWLLYAGDGGDARGLTHVHRMGPIRGPEEG